MVEEGFYRGVGTFAPPLTARRDGAQVVVEVADANPVGGATSIALPVLEHTSTAPCEESLRGLLVAAGLYAREAQAMLDTWRTTRSDGLRVFYLVPRAATDAILPLDIEPPPAELVRVLVGRAEIEGGAE
jgi:hypothetical protein